MDNASSTFDASQGTAEPALTSILSEPHSPIFKGWVLAFFVLILLVVCSATGAAKQVVTCMVDPRRQPHRYILLCLICLFIPGSYFHDAIIATYKGPISDRLNLTTAQFEYLFAVSSLSGVFCGAGGAVISQLGRTRSAVYASLMAVIGSTIVTLGYQWEHVVVMLVGRFIFWLSLNGLIQVQTILCYDLYNGVWLNFAMTCIVCSIRFGGSLSYPLSGPLLHRLGVLKTLWFTVALVFGAFCSTLLFAKFFRGTETARAIWPMLETRTRKEKFSLKLIRDVPPSVFFFLGGLDIAWGIVFPFEVVGDDMLQKDFGYSADDAGFIIAIAPMISILSPLIAPFLGTTLPQKFVACFSGLVLLTSAFIVLACRKPISGIVILGIGYAVSVCAFYSTMPMFVTSQVPLEKGKLFTDTVVGLNFIGSSLTMIFSNMAIGIIKDNFSYQAACIFLAVLGFFGIVSVVVAASMHRPIAAAPVARDESLQQQDSIGGTALVAAGAFNIMDVDITENYVDSFSRS